MVKAIVVGGGVFGLTAAIEIATRGHAVTLLDPGPIPHPLAESTAIGAGHPGTCHDSPDTWSGEAIEARR